MRKLLAYSLVATLIGAVFLWLAARDLPFDAVEAYLASADPGHLALWAAIFVAVYAVSHGARVVRWYQLVRPLGEVEPAKVHRIGAVGFTAIMLLPLRLGELVRPYLLARRSALSMSSALGTAVVERVVDGLVITGLLFATLATYDGERAIGFARTTGLVSAAIFVPALGVCLLALWRKAWTVALVERLIGVVSAGLASRLAGMLDAFIDGFRGLVAGGTAARFLGLTLLYWGANVASMWLLARYGFELALGPWEVATVMAILVVGIMIPAGPGLAGNFEFFLLRGLGLFLALELAAVEARAAAFAAALHILQFAVIVVPGLGVMWADPESRHLIRLVRQADEEVDEEAAEQPDEPAGPRDGAP